MSDTNKKILLVLGAILILVATFMFVVKPKRESIASLESQNAELQARLDDLIEKEKHKDEYIEETAEFNRQFDEVVANYPADLNQESTVMFMKGVEESLDFINDAFAMPRASSFYVLGGGDVSEDTDEEAYVCQTDAYSISYNGTYEGLKDYLAYIADYKYRMAISSVSIAYNADAAEPIDECVGNIILNAYSISGPDREPEHPVVSVKEGKENIFEGVEGGVSSAVSYDSDNGEGIATSHSLVILLNSADNDTSSGIIVASNESNEDTYVTSSSATEETLDITISSEDGKNYMTYAIGSKSYKTEILSSNVAVYVKSSTRTGADDKNGVKVNITNSTDLGVYIKVDGDDSSNPRFNLGSKSGTVKVY